jgi:hypothetical protein
MSGYYSVCGGVGGVAGYLLGSTAGAGIMGLSLAVGAGSLLAKRMCDASQGSQAGDFLQVISSLDYKTDGVSFGVAALSFYATTVYMPGWNGLAVALVSGLFANYTAAQLLDQFKI